MFRKEKVFTMKKGRIFIDKRYFSQFRYGNNLTKILKIIKISFLHFYNQLLMNLCNNHKFDEIYNLLNKTIEGIKKIQDNQNISAEDNKRYNSLVNELSNLLERIKN